MINLARLALLAPALALAMGARADTIKVLTAGAFKQVIEAVKPGFEAKTGHKIEYANDTAGALQKRVAGGEAFDVLVVTPVVMTALASGGAIDSASVSAIAKVGIGVAVKAGAPLPRIDTVDEFRRSMLAARAVAHSDPATGGTTGVYLVGVFQRLGIADAMRAKAVLVSGTFAAEKILTGEADLALQPISELLPVKGTVVVGPLPESLQLWTTYSGAISARAAHRQAANDFLAALKSPEMATLLRDKGMLSAN